MERDWKVRDWVTDPREDRSWEYKDWKRNNIQAPGWDADLIYCHFLDSSCFPMIHTEVTRGADNPKYRMEVIKRYYQERGQAEFCKMISKKLGVPSYLVLFGEGLKWFYVWDFLDKADDHKYSDSDWIRQSLTEHHNWINKLLHESRINIKTKQTNRDLTVRKEIL